MTTLIINDISKEFWLNFNIVKSWSEYLNFKTKKDAESFFDENIDIIKAKPIVKWVWWKRQLLPKLQELFPKEFNNYHEPFLWWGAVFLSIQKNKSYLSDLNLELINTYKTIQNNPWELIDFLKTCKYDKEFFYDIRSWDRGDDFLEKYTDIERAGRFLYLNRTCFNGLYRVNSKGQFNVPMGKYKNPDFIQEENILNVSKLLNKTEAQIKYQSFEEILNTAKSWDFVYFDPPYDVLTKTASFTSYDESGFGRDMQVRLRDIFAELDSRWVKAMMTNHNTDFIRKIYDWYDFTIVHAKRNVSSKASSRKWVEEIVVRNY